MKRRRSSRKRRGEGETKREREGERSEEKERGVERTAPLQSFPLECLLSLLASIMYTFLKLLNISVFSMHALSSLLNKFPALQLSQRSKRKRFTRDASFSLKNATASSLTRASCFSWSSKGYTNATGSHQFSFNHELSNLSTRAGANAKLYVNPTAWRGRAKKVSKSYITRFSVGVLNNDMWASFFFFKHCFQTFSLSIFSQMNENQLVGALRAHFRQRVVIDKQPELFL